MDPATSLERTRTALLAVLGSPERVKAYLHWALHRVAARDLLLPENLRRFQAQAGQSSPEPRRPAAAALRHKGLYAKPYTCLFDRTVFTALKVKGSFEGEEGARHGEDEDREGAVLLHSVQVCPMCYFASADKNHFAFDSPDPEKSDLVPTARQVRLVQDRYPDRAAIVRACPPTLFTEQRSPQDALAAHRLAAMCAQTLHEGDPKRDPHLLRAMGRYHLNAAHLSRRLNRPEASDPFRREALACFQEAYSTLQGDVAYETLFVMMKLSGELTDAGAVLRWGGEARRLFDARESVVDAKERLSLDKHLKKINAVYEDFFQRRGEDRHIMNL